MVQPPHNFIFLPSQSAVALYHAARGDVAAFPWSPWTTTPWRRPWMWSATTTEAAEGAMSSATPGGDDVCAADVADGHPRARSCRHRALARLMASSGRHRALARMMISCRHRALARLLASRRCSLPPITSLTIFICVAPHKSQQQEQQLQNQQQHLTSPSKREAGQKRIREGVGEGRR